ncbi:MAG: lytic transglycosylase domain-containing protein [Desulfonatronovibrio sp. MSAO_Bac4]|nr:MAG: lytic transglycosylase domain-containing protein [Desulfonatronovibrio sp. MSAO_Bac4]
MIFILFMFIPGISQANGIYYYQDENGTFHFTDLPTSDKFRPFGMFRTRDPHSQDIVQLTHRYGRLYSIDPVLIQAMIQVESNFNPVAVSHAGAEGLMQIMPETQKDLGLTTPFDPRDNIEAGTRYFRYLIDRFGDVSLALAAYNAGPGRVERYNGIPPFRETQNYVRKVLEIYAQNK